jgi:hypothetical protein
VQRLRPSLLAAGVIAIGGCSTNAFSGDPFPIHTQQASGAVLVEVQRGAQRFTASLDVLSPITVVDPGPGLPIRRRSDLLTIRGLTEPGGAAFVARAQVPATVFELHPCDETTVCAVGGEAGVVPIGGIIGADSLAGDAVRLDFPTGDVYILPDIAGEDSARLRVCDAVFQTPYRGGGTLLLDGAEIPFAGRRVALGVCADATPRTQGLRDPAPTGVDLLLVLSTGVGTTILGRSAYDRWRDAQPTPPDEPAGAGWVMLPSGRVDGLRATINSLSLTATRGSDPRGPCREVWASKLAEDDCVAGDLPDRCACDGLGFCGAPSVLDLRPATPIDVLVVPDDNAVLQSLRAELRPDEAEVDGILGTDALRSAQLDIDYPNNRVLGRCPTDDPGCWAWPQFDSNTQARSRSCVYSGAGRDAGPDAGPDPMAPDAGVPDAGAPPP